MKLTELKIGQTEELFKAFTYLDVEQFAKLSLDNNPVHLNEEYAKTTIFKNRIVHGLLCASLISAVIGTKLPGVLSI